MSDDTTQILISWLRCFDDDERDQRMASRCADTIQSQADRIEALTAVKDAANEWRDALRADESGLISSDTYYVNLGGKVKELEIALAALEDKP